MVLRPLPTSSRSHLVSIVIASKVMASKVISWHSHRKYHSKHGQPLPPRCKCKV